MLTVQSRFVDLGMKARHKMSAVIESDGHDLNRCRWALDEAVDRWRMALTNTIRDPVLPDRQYAAISEALMWAATLDDICGPKGLSECHALDCSKLREREADLLDGLHFARKRIVHQLVRTNNHHQYAGAMELSTKDMHHITRRE